MPSTDGRGRRLRTAVAMIFVATAVAACGSSANSGSAGASNAGSQSSHSKAGVAAAKADLRPYMGKPSAFPVGAPLVKRPAAGGKLMYLQCSAVTCAEAAKLVRGGAQALGLTYQAVDAGASTTQETAAMNTIIAAKPMIVILPGINAQPLCSQIKQLVDAGVGVGTVGMVGVSKCGVKTEINGGASAELAGRLMADWVLATKGADANVVFYYTPELSFSPYAQSGFKKQFTKLCASCTIRFVDLSLTSYGSSAPSTVVSDLQSHRQTNTAVFVSLEAAIGLPAALKTAGLNVSTIGWGAQPANLQDIKAGSLTAGIGVDIPTMFWTAIDGAARTVTHQPLTAAEKSGIPPTEVLERRDVTFDPAKGFAPYPDFAQRFARLWTKH